MRGELEGSLQNVRMMFNHRFRVNLLFPYNPPAQYRLAFGLQDMGPGKKKWYMVAFENVP